MKQRLVCERKNWNDSVNPRDESGSNHSAIVLSQGGVDEQSGQKLNNEMNVKDRTETRINELLIYI